MRGSNWIRIAAVSAALLAVTTVSAQAQVINKKKSEANPAVAIFKATLYGAGTGLVLGGAYALVENDPDVSTGDALKWGIAGGAVGGALVGLVYVLTRSTAKGSVKEVGDVDEGALTPGLAPVDDSPRLRAPTLAFESDRGPVNTRYEAVRVSVVRVGL